MATLSLSCGIQTLGIQPQLWLRGGMQDVLLWHTDFSLAVARRLSSWGTQA